MKEENIVKFLLEVGKLKKIKRTGWLLKGVKMPESVAEHSFRVTMMAMVLSEDKNLDKFRLLKMALVHDIAESIISDIVWEHGKISDLEKLKTKHKKELKAAENIFSNLEKGREYFELVVDFLRQESKEARFLKEIDKLEMALQTLEYENIAEHSLEEFWENIEKYLKNKKLIEIFEEVKSLRKRNW